jgi:hypothetical protein
MDGTTMNFPQLDATRLSDSLDKGLSWWDPDTECTIVVAEPSADTELWTEYLDGALRSYRKHGVESALDIDAIRGGHGTSVFFAAVDDAGRVVGGVRGKGPLGSADDSHAVAEWAGRPGERAVRKMITDRLPFGVVEMKSAWVTDDPGLNGALTNTLARTAFPTMALLDCQFVMATAAAHVLDRWRSSGGVVVSRIPATPYPDERYRTKMMWWDRLTFANHAEPKQLSKVLAEMRALTQSPHGTAQLGDRPG